ncbi:MAG: helix-turn-helix domain-containing protein [Pseudomonadota bacterium]
MPKPLDSVNQSSRSTAEEVFESIHEVMHLYRSQRHRAPDDGEEGLSHMESKALGFFARNPGATQSELALHSGRDKSQLARLVGGLRERGLLEARADEADRRNIRMELTAAAKELHRAMQLRARKRARAAIAGLGDDDCRQLVELLGRIRANLETSET